MSENIGEFSFRFDPDFAKAEEDVNNFQGSVDKLVVSMDTLSGSFDDFSSSQDSSTRATQTWGTKNLMWIGRVSRAMKKFYSITKATFTGIQQAIAPGLSIAQQADDMMMDPTDLNNWTLAMQHLGLSTDTATGALTKLDDIRKNFARWSVMKGPQYLAAEMLGVDPQDFEKTDPGQLLQKIMQSAAERVSIGQLTPAQARSFMDMFGIRQSLFERQGEVGGALAATRQYAITPEHIKNQRDLAKSVTEVSGAFTRLLNDTLVLFGPELDRMLQGIKNLAGILEGVALRLKWITDPTTAPDYVQAVDKGIESAIGQGPITEGLQLFNRLMGSILPEPNADGGQALGSYMYQKAKDVDGTAIMEGVMGKIGSGLEGAILKVAPAPPKIEIQLNVDKEGNLTTSGLMDGQVVAFGTRQVN